jgi:hypothetical protein
MQKTPDNERRREAGVGRDRRLLRQNLQPHGGHSVSSTAFAVSTASAQPKPKILRAMAQTFCVDTSYACLFEWRDRQSSDTRD